MSFLRLRLVLPALLALAFLGFANVATADTQLPGAKFNHNYWATNSCTCATHITHLYKTWESENGSLTRVYYGGGGVSYSQTGEVDYPVDIWLQPGESTRDWSPPIGIAFETNAAIKNDVIRSTFRFDYENNCAETLVSNTATVTTTIAPPVGADLCLNLPGVQTEVPADYTRDPATNTCTKNPPSDKDLCDNIAGMQTVVPPDYTRDPATNICTKNPPSDKDLCDNIAGMQTVVPPDYTRDPATNKCYLDLCRNLTGNQTAVPDGYTRDSSGNCNPGGSHAFCGDGTVDSSAGEKCDAGAQNGACPAACSSTCQPNSCGGGPPGGGGTPPGGGGGGNPTPPGGQGGDSTPPPGGQGGGDGDRPTHGNACPLSPQYCGLQTVQTTGRLPTFTPDAAGNINFAIDYNLDVNCLQQAEVCVQVRNAPIVGAYRNDLTTGWSSCLAPDRFKINANRTLSLPVQSKEYYEVRMGTYAYTAEGQRVASPAAINFDESKNWCFFDTRIPPITVNGIANNRVGDSVYPEARNQMNPNIYRLLQPIEDGSNCRIVGGHWMCGCDARDNGSTLRGAWIDSLEADATYRTPTGAREPLARCLVPGTTNVYYFDPAGGTVTLDAPGSTLALPDRKVTLLVKGADLRLADNLVYQPGSAAGSFGAIVLYNQFGGTAYHGNIRVGPAPTNLAGAYYTEGRVEAATSDWGVPASRSDPAWYYHFRNQLFWRGTVLSQNTVLGARDDTNYHSYPWQRSEGTSFCPALTHTGNLACNWNDAVKTDLAELREFFYCQNPAGRTNYAGYNPGSCSAAGITVGGGLPATGTPARTAVVLQYDGRIESNPPPGFEGVAHLLQGELGL